MNKNRYDGDWATQNERTASKLDTISWDGIWIKVY